MRRAGRRTWAAGAWSCERPGDGVYAYETAERVRYRFLFRQADGSLSIRRGFTSRRAAVTARRRLIESIERCEVKPTRETFGEFWTRYLEERRPYLTSGTRIDFATHGRKRIVADLRPDAASPSSEKTKDRRSHRVGTADRRTTAHCVLQL